MVLANVSLLKIVACDELDLQQDHVREAYFVFEAIANFNNHLIAISQGILAAQTDSKSFNEKWVETFSYKSAFPASSASTKQILGGIVSGRSTTISNPCGRATCRSSEWSHYYNLERYSTANVRTYMRLE